MNNFQKNLEQLFREARNPDTNPNDQAPFGFAERVVAHWREIRKQEPWFQVFNRLVNPALACSWIIALLALVYTWQAGSIGFNADSASSGLYENYYADEGEENIWPPANG
jgi:hypothetical protein